MGRDAGARRHRLGRRSRRDAKDPVSEVLTVVDTSAWVEYERGTGSAAHRALSRLLSQRARIAVTEVIVMEVLAGSRHPRLAAGIRGFEILPLCGLADFELAAALHRACQAAGETIRELTDCLIAVPTIRAGATLLHVDRDFDILARHTPLQVEPLPG